MRVKGTEEKRRGLGMDDAEPDVLGLYDEDYVWLSSHVERGNGHAQSILASLMQLRRTLMMRSEHDAYSVNEREAGLEPMTWMEWRGLDLLEQERDALRKRRPGDVADLY